MRPVRESFLRHVPALRMFRRTAGSPEGEKMPGSSEKMVKKIKIAARSSDRAVIYLNLYILIVIAEMLAEESQTADPLGRLLYLETKPETVLGGQ